MWFNKLHKDDNNNINKNLYNMGHRHWILCSFFVHILYKKNIYNNNNITAIEFKR
jgi:hypothetical protein